MFPEDLNYAFFKIHLKLKKGLTLLHNYVISWLEQLYVSAYGNCPGYKAHLTTWDNSCERLEQIEDNLLLLGDTEWSNLVNMCQWCSYFLFVCVNIYFVLTHHKGLFTTNWIIWCFKSKITLLTNKIVKSGIHRHVQHYQYTADN